MSSESQPFRQSLRIISPQGQNEIFSQSKKNSSKNQGFNILPYDQNQLTKMSQNGAKQVSENRKNSVYEPSFSLPLISLGNYHTDITMRENNDQSDISEKSKKMELPSVNVNQLFRNKSMIQDVMQTNLLINQQRFFNISQIAQKNQQEVYQHFVKNAKLFKKKLENINNKVRVIQGNTIEGKNKRKLFQDYEQQQQQQQQGNNMNIIIPSSSSVLTGNSGQMYNNYKFYSCNQVLENWKPNIREGATFCALGTKIYLYGGLSGEFMEDINKYDIQSQTWKCLVQNGDKPQQGRTSHSVNVYGRSLLFFGGEYKSSTTFKRRECLSEARIYMLDNYEWKQLRCTGDLIEGRRNHVSFLLGKTLIVQGGFNSRGKILNDVWALNLYQLKWFSVSSGTPETNELYAMAYHTCQPVYYSDRKFYNYQSYSESKMEILSDSKLKMEGIYFFGGIYSKGECLNQIRVLIFGQGQAKWVSPEIQGIAPQGRFGHTMTYYENRQILVVYGGRNDQKFQENGNLYSNQVSVLNLLNLTWYSVEMYGQQLEARAFHSCEIVDSKLYIFGGLNLSGYLSANICTIELDQKKSVKLNEEDIKNKAQNIQQSLYNSQYEMNPKQQQKKQKPQQFISYLPISKDKQEFNLKDQGIDQGQISLKNKIKKLILSHKLRKFTNSKDNKTQEQNKLNDSNSPDELSFITNSDKN